MADDGVQSRPPAAAKMIDGFAPLLDGFDHVPFDDDDALRAAIGEQTAGDPGRADPGRGRHPAAAAERLRLLRACATSTASC